MSTGNNDPTPIEVKRNEERIAVGVEMPSGAAVIEWLSNKRDEIHTYESGIVIQPAPEGIEDLLEVYTDIRITSIEEEEQSTHVIDRLSEEKEGIENISTPGEIEIPSDRTENEPRYNNR